jgi:flagellar motor switch protein FliM
MGPTHTDKEKQKKDSDSSTKVIGTFFGKEILCSSFPKDKKIEVNLYDFLRPDKFSREQIRTLSIIHETFARLSTISLSAQLRYPCELHVEMVDQATFEEYIHTLPNPTTMAIVSMDPLKGSGVLQIDNDLVFPIMERLAGRTKVEKLTFNRDLSYIEQSLVEGIVIRLLKNLQEAWSFCVPMAPRLGQIETNPQFAQIVPPLEMVIIVVFICKIDTIESKITLCLPYLTLEPIISMLSAQYWYSSVMKKKAVNQNIPVSGLKAESSLFYESEKLSLNRLYHLKPGSLIRITGLEKGEAILSCGGERVMKLKPEKTKGGLRSFGIIDDKTGKKDLPTGILLDIDDKTRGAQGHQIMDTVSNVVHTLEERMTEGLNTIEKRLKEITARQDELADQLYFGLAGGELKGKELKQDEKPFHFLHSFDKDHVFNFIRQEHPQVIALILAYLEPYYAGAIMGKFPEILQIDIAERIAHMERTAPAVLKEMEKVLQQHMELTDEVRAAGGIGAVVEILSLAERSVERNIIEGLEKKNSTLADDIKKRLFVFEDICLLDPKAMEEVLKKTDLNDIVVALKGCSSEVKEHILSCLDEKERVKVHEESKEIGPVHVKDVEGAQQRIVTTIKELEEKGLIIVAHMGEVVE